MKASEALERELALEQEDFQARARKGLLNFTLYTKPDFEISWHHKVLCKYLNGFIRGQIPRLLIMAPPRHTKSELVSRRMPALILGQNPDLEVISATYNAKFASRLNRDVQRIITAPRYRELFPGTRLNERNIRTVADGSWLRNAEMFEIVGRKGYYLAAGIGGSLTGSGGDVAIIDDPVKDWKSATSDTERDNVWEWYSSVLYTRLSKVGRVCLTLTRWHEDDLAGRIEAQMKADPEADQWTIVRLPAIKEGTKSECPDDLREPGEALWPERFPVPRLHKVKHVNESIFVSLYQQRPAPLEGNIIKRAWWRRFKVFPARASMDEVLLSIDLPYKRKKKTKKAPGSDYAAFQIWGRRGPDVFLLDSVHGRMNFDEQLAAATKILEAWPEAMAKLVEAKANGEALINQLRKKVPGLIGVNPLTDKVNRAWAISPFVKAGNVWIPDPSIAPWVEEYILEWAVFPAGANDDQVDATTQAILYWFGTMLQQGAPPISFTKESYWEGASGGETSLPWLSPAEDPVTQDDDDVVRTIALR